MVIGCCDSRVSPEVIFDARPGELFVVRNVANIMPPYAPDGQAHGVSAALEFGVGALHVKHIVVLGHAHCGGVKAYAEDAEPLSPGDFIGKWMKLMAPAADKIGPRGDSLAGRLSDAARAGQYRQQPRQSDDVSAARQTDRDAARSRPTAPISASRRAICRCWIRRAASDVRSRRSSAAVLIRCVLTAKARIYRSVSMVYGVGIPAFAGTTKNYAALRFAWISLRLISTSAICTALSAAPLRRLSDTTQISRPLSTVGSVRMRLM